MTSPLIERAEQHQYQQLFIHDLNWSRPDQPPITIEYEDRTVTATNVSQYKGIRVWVVDEAPDSKLEAELDRVLAQASVDRILIFHDDTQQVWRWPVRRSSDNSTTTRLSRHRHRNGDTDPGFANKLDVIRLPFDVSLDSNAVLAKVRQAFDVEARNETKHASKLMARLYMAMEKAYPDGIDEQTRDHEISVTLARILFLMFGDDTDMWPENLFQNFILDHTIPDGSDIGTQLTNLFAYVDTRPEDRGTAPPAFDGFRYVNGGIFKERLHLPELDSEFRSAVLDACERDWKTISPAIFGSMFQSVRDAKTRRELGEHYTSEDNILKTLNPLFLDGLRSEFEHIKTLGKHEAGRLRKLREKLGRIRYLDPACGCGNFIIVTYRELRDLELAIMERLQQITGDQAMLVANVGLMVTLDHFYGIEIDEWPARIAETAMFLIDRQCDLKLTASLGWAPDRLPIQQQATIVIHNALSLDWSSVVTPTDDLVIAGNPPFIGHKERSRQQGEELRSAWSGNPIGHLDYVTGWYARASDFLQGTDARWAFVSTNSVCQGEGVPALFGKIISDGWRIRFAHRAFQWRSEASDPAGVQCVILGFDRNGHGAELFSYANPKATAERARVEVINPYLVAAPDVLVRPRKSPIADLPEIRAGSTPIDWDNLVLKAGDQDALLSLRSDPIAAQYLRRYMGGKELIHSVERWCLWIQPASTDLERNISKSDALTERVGNVRKKRLASGRAVTRKLADLPHSFGEVRQPGEDYLAIPQTFSENRPFATAAPVSRDVIASVKLFTADDPDGYLFALISSSMFLTWQLTVGGRLESRPSFSSSVVWNTFPVPRLSDDERSSISEAGQCVIAARANHHQLTLAQLYNRYDMPQDLRAAHEDLDELVDAAFGLHDGLRSFEVRQRILFLRYVDLSERSSAVEGPGSTPG